MRYAVVVERSRNSVGAYVPNLPGCVAVAESEAEVRELIREAIELHLDALREDGAVIPAPVTRIGYVEVPDAGDVADLCSPLGVRRVAGFTFREQDHPPRGVT